MENGNEKSKENKGKISCKLYNALFPNSIKRPLIIIGALVFLVMVAAMVLENTALIDGKNLSGYFREEFGKRTNTGDYKGEATAVGYILYYMILYLGVVLYVLSSLIICTKKTDKEWCALNIAISIIFMIAVDAWLTLTLQYNEGTLYNMHLLCYISVATVISSISAAKMTKSSIKVKIVKDDENNDKDKQ